MKAIMGVHHKCATTDGHADAAVSSLEQFQLEPPLDFPQLLAESGLADPNPRGGARHVALFVQYEEHL